MTHSLGLARERQRKHNGLSFQSTVFGVRERREGWRVQAQDLGSGSKHSLDLL